MLSDTCYEVIAALMPIVQRLEHDAQNYASPEFRYNKEQLAMLNDAAAQIKTIAAHLNVLRAELDRHPAPKETDPITDCLSVAYREVALANHTINPDTKVDDLEGLLSTIANFVDCGDDEHPEATASEMDFLARVLQCAAEKILRRSHRD